jgi:hypothetical protein
MGRGIDYEKNNTQQSPITSFADDVDREDL